MDRGAKRSTICDPEGSRMMNITIQTANTHTFSWYSNSQFISSVIAIIGARTGWFIGTAGMYFMYFTPWWAGDGLWWHYNIVMYLYVRCHLYILYLHKVLHYKCTDHPLGVPPFGWTDPCHLTFLCCVHQPPTLACPLCTPSHKIYKKMQRSTISHLSTYLSTAISHAGCAVIFYNFHVLDC
jgi:hypothetical protein